MARRRIATGGCVGAFPLAFGCTRAGIYRDQAREEALARAGDGSSNKGREAALAALEMVALYERLSGRGSEARRR